MAASEQVTAIESNREGVVHSLAEAWVCVNLLRGLSDAARKALPEAHSRCAQEFYRSTFSALYATVGTILDTSDGVHSFPKIGQRLRSYWQSDLELVAVVDEVLEDLAADQTAAKFKAWRNKVISHRTHRAAEPEFYERNKVTLEEVAHSLDAIVSLLNRLSVNFDGVVYHGLETTVPGLSDDVSRLFGGSA